MKPCPECGADNNMTHELDCPTLAQWQTRWNLGPLWVRTRELRWLRRGRNRVLQQMWKSTEGEVEWRDVEEVEE